MAYMSRRIWSISSLNSIDEIGISLQPLCQLTRKSFIFQREITYRAGSFLLLNACLFPLSHRRLRSRKVGFQLTGIKESNKIIITSRVRARSYFREDFFFCSYRREKKTFFFLLPEILSAPIYLASKRRRPRKRICPI